MGPPGAVWGPFCASVGPSWRTFGGQQPDLQGPCAIDGTLVTISGRSWPLRSHLGPVSIIFAAERGLRHRFNRPWKPLFDKKVLNLEPVSITTSWIYSSVQGIPGQSPRPGCFIRFVWPQVFSLVLSPCHGPLELHSGSLHEGPARRTLMHRAHLRPIRPGAS